MEIFLENYTEKLPTLRVCSYLVYEEQKNFMNFKFRQGNMKS